MEINFDYFINNNNLFLHHINNNILSYEEKILKAEYIANKNKYIKQDKQNLRDKIKNIRGGKTKEPSFDIYSYILAELYDIESYNSKQKIKDHFVNKLTQTGGGLSDIISALDLATVPLSSDKKYTEDLKTKGNTLIKKYVDQVILDSLEKHKSNMFLTGPIGSNIMDISKDLQNMKNPEDIYKLTEQQTINRMFVHLGNINNIKTNGSEDIKSVIDHFKTHGLFATMYLNNIVKEIDKSGKEQSNFEEIIKQLKVHEDNLIAIIKKITTIDEFIKNSTEELKKEENYNIYPLDLKIVSGKYLNKLYPGKKEYYIDVDKIKIQFSQMPKTVDSIVKEIRNRARNANKKVPGVAHSLFTSIKNIDTFNLLIKDLRINNTALNHVGGGNDLPDNLTPDLLNKIDASQTTNEVFSTTIKTRKEVGKHINVVGQLVNQLDTKIDKLVSTIEYFNLTESREHFYSYVMANLALNANGRRKYRYMSFGVLDFYKSIIDTIFKKIDYDKDGNEKIIGSDSKYLFFYHYHYKIIKKLKVFLDKFYELKNLNLFYTNNTFIEISECTGKVKEYLSLLNIYKYLLDDFYAKIGLGKSTSNVSVYLRINDFPREKLLLGRQFGTIYNSSVIEDKGARNITGNNTSAFIYNTELLNRNNANYIFRTNHMKSLLNKINDINSSKVDLKTKLGSIFSELLDNNKYKPEFNWQVHQGGVQYSKFKPDTGGIKERQINLKNEELYYVKKNDNNDIIPNAKDLIDVMDTEGKFINEAMYTLKSTDQTLKNLYNERERRRFFLVNRKVPTINEYEYTNEEYLEIDDETKLKKIEFDETNLLSIDLPSKEIYNNFLKPLNGAVRPCIAKILFLPLLFLLTDNSRKALGLNDMYNDFKNLKIDLLNKKIEYKQNIKLNKNDTSEIINIEFNNNQSIINFYKKFMNNSKIIYPLIIGFIPYSLSDTDTFNFGVDVNGENGIYTKYKNKFIGFGISSFNASNTNDSLIDETTTEFDHDLDNEPDLSEVKSYHFLLKRYFKSLFFEQDKTYRDESELIFSASQDDKKLVIQDKENCRRLLDRYSNEDDFAALDKLDKTIETPFNHVFSSEKTPDNESIAMFMSIPSKLSMGNGFMLLTFGYSGTGKSYTIFGKKEKKIVNGIETIDSARGILQSTLDEVEVADNEIYFRCYEMYGIGFPYANYWYDKIDNKFDPKRIELLIHHQFKTDGDILKPEKQHIFDDPELKKRYLSNNNWFFPDAGYGEYKYERDKNTNDIKNLNNGKNAEFKEHELAPDDFDKCIYVGDHNSIYPTTPPPPPTPPTPPSFIPYVKYNNEDKKKYFTPRKYSEYKENNIDKVDIIPIELQNVTETDKAGKNITVNGKSILKNTTTKSFADAKKEYIDYDTTNNKSKSTYVKISPNQIDCFGELVDEIDKNRKKPVDINKTLYNNHLEKIPENFKYIKRIKETANNPESSRSIVFYEFVIKLKEMKEVTIEDEYGRKMTVWRKYVTLLIVDLPGQEDIKTSFVEKPEYNVTGPGLPKPTFSFASKSEQEIRTDINSNILFTYQDNTDKLRPIKDTNTDINVYKYNEYLQKLIKTTLYMNPLFKFMTKIPNRLNLKYPVNISNDKYTSDYLLINAWSVNYPLTVASPNMSNDTSKSIQFNDFCNNFITISNSSSGSEIYRENTSYILNGIRLYQTHPFDYLVDYIFDDVLKNDNNSEFNIYKALSPYEGYMINENVGSLITYLFNKTRTKSLNRKIESLKEQQHNFADYLINDRMFSKDIDTKYDNLNEANNESVAKNITPFIIEISDPLMHGYGRSRVSVSSIKSRYNLKYKIPKLSELYDNYDKISTIEKKFKKGVYYNIDGMNSTSNPTYAQPNSLEIHDGMSFFSNDLARKSIFENIKSNPPINYTYMHPSKDINDNSLSNNDYNDNIEIRPVKDATYTFNSLLGIKEIWKKFEKHVFQYLFYIEIFLILKKLRGLDKYFREKTMQHILRSQDGKIMTSKIEFDNNLIRLKHMYDFYVNEIVNYDKEKTYDSPQGIYNKNYLFRNGNINEYLKNTGNHFYKDRMDEKIFVSEDQNLELTYPEFEMLNKKPLIFSYLEPYEPFFNTYSLLYVMSNNDPHIKCYKQIELLDTNSRFIKTVVNV